MPYHVPVLLQESVDGLNIQEHGTYVDVTFGGGGHTREIFKRLSAGKLIAFDQDPDALENAEDLRSHADRSFIFVPSNFRYMQKYLKLHGIADVDGILGDLGVSSYQINTGTRGFSTRTDGDLDMRMNRSGETTAQDVVNHYEEQELVHMFSFYGEVRNARTLAARIIRERMSRPVRTTSDLRAIATQVAPKGKLEKYLAQVFQAIRIEVNDELSALKELLTQSVKCLKPGGRLVVISYHSLEDRLVKNFLGSGNFQGKPEKDFFGKVIRPFTPVNRKPIIPDENEIANNKRARSAKLRIATRNDGQ